MRGDEDNFGRPVERRGLFGDERDFRPVPPDLKWVVVQQGGPRYLDKPQPAVGTACWTTPGEPGRLLVVLRWENDTWPGYPACVLTDASLTAEYPDCPVVAPA